MSTSVDKAISLLLEDHDDREAKADKGYLEQYRDAYVKQVAEIGEYKRQIQSLKDTLLVVANDENAPEDLRRLVKTELSKVRMEFKTH